jgi:outer membrane protein OmpA-like peptidoglycan-associated protein
MRIESTADSTREIYNLILFPFDKSDAGAINERIMNDYVYGRVYPTSAVDVVGHTDVVGMYEHNKKLSDRRSEYVRTGINKKSGGKYGSLSSRGVGEEDPLYTNDLPEGRFYNRTVQVLVKTPLLDIKDE